METIIDKIFPGVMSGEIKIGPSPMDEQRMKSEESQYKLGISYENIIDTLRRYTELKEDYYKLLSIWIIGTYFHKDFETYPFLFLNAMRGSGKTRLLKLISILSKGGNGSVNNNLTDAVLFRHLPNTIMCIDEAEQIGSKEKQTLRELLNSAYKKGMQVQRMKKVKKDGQEKHEAEIFEPYFPIALANIWGVEEVLADRSIVLQLEKSSNPAITKKIEDFDKNQSIQDIKRTLTVFSDVCDVTLRKKTYITSWNDYIDKKYNVITSHIYITTLNVTNDTSTVNKVNIKEMVEMVERDEFFEKLDSSGIDGRNFELFFPLLITARMINEETFEDILKIANSMVHDKREEEYTESKDVSLYEFVAEQAQANEYTPLKELTAHFRLFVGDTGNDETWVNEKWMGRALKRLCLILEKKKMASGRFVRLDKEKAKEKLKIFK